MPVCDVCYERRDRQGTQGLAPTAHKQVSVCTCQAWGSENPVCTCQAWGSEDPAALLADRDPQLLACTVLSGASPGRGRRV